MKKIISILLCLVLLFSIAGCGGEAASVNVSETPEEAKLRDDLEYTLRNLYAGPSTYTFDKSLEPLEFVASATLQGQMKEFFGSQVKYLDSQKLFEYEEFKGLCVVAVLVMQTGERQIYKDILITRVTDGKLLVVLQENLDEATQKAIMAKRDETVTVSDKFLKGCLAAYGKESKVFADWYKKCKDVVKINSTALSVLNEVKIAENVYTRGGRTLVWSEEFENVKKLSDTKMAYYRTMNNESLLITRDDSNLSFKDGVMTMYARPSTDERYHYSIPDGVTTYGTMAYIGGYLEMRAKVPFEHGAWPSFWEKSYPGLYSTNYQAEIDIFEVFSNETELSSCLHKWGVEHYSGGIGTNTDFYFESNEVATDWHTYGFEWTDTEYRFYVDGNCYCVLYVDEANDFVKDPDVIGMEGFQDYHYVILNNFIFNNASSWAPAGTRLEDNETKVIEYSVDYIRLYQNKTTDKIIIFKEQ
jgi:hypothetical protein